MRNGTEVLYFSGSHKRRHRTSMSASDYDDEAGGHSSTAKWMNMERAQDEPRARMRADGGKTLGGGRTYPFPLHLQFAKQRGEKTVNTLTDHTNAVKTHTQHKQLSLNLINKDRWKFRVLNIHIP